MTHQSILNSARNQRHTRAPSLHQVDVGTLGPSVTVGQLIDRCLTLIRSNFYQGRPAREYHRDEPALMRALARYGYGCAQRGWHFDAKAIAGDLTGLLRRIADSKADPEYFPVYLQAAVDSHIGNRAEELSARAKLTAPKVSKLVKQTQGVVAIVTPTDTEILATVYRDLAARKAARRQARRRTKQDPEPMLL